jgi:hypothetical protein
MPSAERHGERQNALGLVMGGCVCWLMIRGKNGKMGKGVDWKLTKGSLWEIE